MRRGVLRIYLGAAPGVGKTVAMLGEGHRRVERGADVVVGVVETHERRYTSSMVEGFEVIPRREVHHRGATFMEMDVDAIVARAPQIVLVDELAHSNAPGSPRARRYEDIAVLLDAGIDVISTVNIQHVESLNDAVHTITGVRQRETVPDDVVRRADQIELVDMSPESLRRRMAHGNVYPAQKVDAALASYFRPGNLAALRELALLWLADRVDEALERYRADHDIEATWPARERVVVALVDAPEGETVLRRGARIASRGAGGELIVVHIDNPDGLAGPDETQLTRLHRLTEELGGRFHTVTGNDIGAAILSFARRVNASQIVLGASSRGRWARLWSHGVGDTVVAGSQDIDVHLVTHETAERRRRREMTHSEGSLGRVRSGVGWVLAVTGQAVLTVMLSLTRSYHDLPLDMMLYLAVAVATALIGGFGPALVSALLGTLLLNWFFTPPLYTFTVADPLNVFALVVYLMVSCAVASVVHVSARRAGQARVAQHEAASLTRITHAMLSSTAPLPLLLQQCLDMFAMSGGAVVRRRTNEPDVLLATAGEFTLNDVAHAQVSEHIDDDTFLVLTGHDLGISDQSLITAYAANAAAVLTRQRLRAEEAAATSLAQDNRARQALLSAVSHDLRTPLAAVKAAVSSLRSDEVEFGPEDQAELLAAIEESADRLDSLVGNLLDLSRLETGTMRPHCVVFDAAAAAVDVMSQASEPSRLDLWSQGECLAYADPGLFDRVVANLVENALRYTPAESPVLINVATITTPESGTRVMVRVVDNGRGVPRSEHERIFRPFQRHSDVPAGEGVGLGLAVARGLAESMNATVTADDTPGGGLTMTVDLPGAHDLEREGY
ncbi:ATP-binding protein [Austwickia sp. TVS 96-490-7B]|uniref:ATP-binding protein n=1 Tax=Austwickia sp. TVS 96-490-7B TaxID=2830843 RepID=UPI001C58FC7E|nr:ATP-binding protein [Austwickia sp. TVS 96-490-7B]